MTEGRARGSRAEDVMVLFWSDEDGWNQGRNTSEELLIFEINEGKQIEMVWTLGTVFMLIIR